MISILTVSYNTRDFVKLLCRSVKRFTTWPYELIVVDCNSTDGTREWLAEQKGIRLHALPENIKHGPGLDVALSLAQYQYCLVLDSDSHLQRQGWENDLVGLYHADDNTRLVAAKGTADPDSPSAKPIHACFMFFETRVFRDLGMSFIARDGHDVGRKIFYDLRDREFKTLRIDAGYEGPGAVKFYPGCFGDEYYICGRPTIYHNWYSSRMWHTEKVDNYTHADFDKNKARLFEQPLVREIMAGA